MDWKNMCTGFWCICWIIFVFYAQIPQFSSEAASSYNPRLPWKVSDVREGKFLCENIHTSNLDRLQSWQTKNQGYIFTKLLKLIDGGEACRLLRDIDKAWIFPWFPIYNHSVDTKHSTTTLNLCLFIFSSGKWNEQWPLINLLPISSSALPPMRAATPIIICERDTDEECRTLAGNMVRGAFFMRVLLIYQLYSLLIQCFTDLSEARKWLLPKMMMKQEKQCIIFC